MKKFFVFVLLFAGFYLNAHAVDKTLRQQMVEYESKKSSAELNLDKLQIDMSLTYSTFENDFSNMDTDTLKSYLNSEKEYYLGKLDLTEDLNQIYSKNYVSRVEPIDTELKNVLNNLAKHCNLLSKITSKCLSPHESLVFQAEYLKQKIEALETLESSLVYKINSQIVEDDQQSGVAVGVGI
jgi:hypothetical protein